MNIALWICQGPLATLFAYSGAMKVGMSREKMLASGQTGVGPFPMPVIRLTAACELLAAIGLLAPIPSGILPVLTPIAALGLVAVMIGAAIAHYSLGEKRTVAVNVLILLVCVFVAVGRFTGH